MHSPLNRVLTGFANPFDNIRFNTQIPIPPEPNPPRTATDNGDGTVTFAGVTAINLVVINNDDGTFTVEGLQ